MKWCCIGMESHVKNSGDIGFSVIFTKDDRGLAMAVIQDRSMDIDEFKKLKNNLKISAISEMVILYCPWCGNNLEEWYSKYISEISREDLMISSVLNQ